MSDVVFALAMLLSVFFVGTVFSVRVFGREKTSAMLGRAAIMARHSFLSFCERCEGALKGFFWPEHAQLSSQIEDYFHLTSPGGPLADIQDQLDEIRLLLDKMVNEDEDTMISYPEFPSTTEDNNGQ